MSKKGVVLDKRAREIIYNVDKYFESEKLKCDKLISEFKAASISGPNNCKILRPEVFEKIMSMLKNTVKVSERVVQATGINKNTLTRIRAEKRAEDDYAIHIKRRAKETSTSKEIGPEVYIKEEASSDNEDDSITIEVPML